MQSEAILPALNDALLSCAVLLGYANHLIPNMKNGTIMHKTLALESGSWIDWLVLILPSNETIRNLPSPPVEPRGNRPENAVKENRYPGLKHGRQILNPPAVEPTFLEIRQGQGRSVTMSCRVLRAYPTRVLTFEWRLGNKLLRTGQFDAQDSTEYIIRSLSRDSYGVYNCNIINEAGAGSC
uniref:Uncharacterized protein n=1 Tax=Sphaerodactylus townsendi TaxID=933632 RepID=A0ACB8G723_9SAUR